MFGARTAATLARLGPGALARLERLVQVAQGKGWGYSTVVQEAAAVRALLGPAAAHPLVVVDGGANLGSWTYHVLRALPAASIHAVEPSVSAFAKLSGRFEAEPRVSLHRIALSDTNGEAVLYSPEPGSVRGSLTKRRLAGVRWDLQEAVRTTTLGSWARSLGLTTVDVLKLDVEGHELSVLHGAADLLRTVRVLQFEFGAPNIDTRTYFRDFWDLLADAGFQISRLGPGGLHLLPRYTEQDEVFLTTNYFATPPRADYP